MERRHYHFSMFKTQGSLAGGALLGKSSLTSDLMVLLYHVSHCPVVFFHSTSSLPEVILLYLCVFLLTGCLPFACRSPKPRNPVCLVYLCILHLTECVAQGKQARKYLSTD